MVRQDPDDPEVERRSRDTANRVLSSFKAALNRAFRDPERRIASDAAWRKVSPFKAVGRARQVHLDPPQIRRLVNACRGRFRDLVTAGLLTGARYGELVALRVGDFRPDLRTLTVRDGKTGARDVVLTPEGVRFFEGIAAGQHTDALLLPKDDGSTWGKNHHRRLIGEAIAKAKLGAGTMFYSLRHTYVSQALLAGMNMQLLAENLGTSIRMIESNYGKFLAASRRKLIEQHGLKLGLRPSKKV
jgi:integrase